MTLTSARQFVRFFARNAGDSTMYSDAQVDMAISAVGNQFAEKTRCLPIASSLSTVAANPALDVSSLVSLGFRPEKLLLAYLPAGNAGGTGRACRVRLRAASWETLIGRQDGEPRSTVPEMIAFEDWSTAELYPTPDAIYTIKLRWHQPFVTWTYGTGSPDGVTLNLPDEWMTRILSDGVPGKLQLNEPEHKYAATAWQRYLDFEKEMMGKGALGEKSIERSRRE